MIYPRILQAPDRSFFLFGIRGVGKSTWARQQFDDPLRFDLLNERLYQELLVDPGVFAEPLATVDPARWVIVDEIQRLPNLLNEVHRWIEERRLRFALLGSSARKLRAAGTNLLGGRAVWREMVPLLPEELGEDFDLDRVLEIGSIPLVHRASRPKETLRSYVELYLREEIKGEALVRNLPAFARFLPVAALAHGQVVNISAIARDSGAARPTVNGYVEILEDTLVAARLPAFEGRLRVRERRHPKLYWVDPGLVRAVKKQLGPVSEEERGALLEGWVFMLLRAYAQGNGLYDDVGYWAPARSPALEVDFVLQRGRERLAIEVKAGTRVGLDRLRGLEAIGDLEGIVRRIAVYRGDRTRRLAGGIEVWPVRKLLDALRTDTLWP